MLILNPLSFNWERTYLSPKAIEKDLKGFKYKGPGWYTTDTDTLLIQEFQSCKVVKVGECSSEITKYHVQCWNTPVGFEDFFNNVQTLVTLQRFS